ncbi:hypothetical protein L195_g055950 [Trifolium pratense]|uniref:Uncharacterized protein n=1 Tax=Trifolium pratense TaxID=57577 RepID=A0A2K3KP05_TRIPR|nr:hypothetical protein L195_g055950 [Trifolium pratense]
MQNHLKALFIRAKVNNVGINKVLVDGGAVVNIMPHFMLKKLGLYDTDLHSHNVVLANYEGKTGHSLGGSAIRKWIHGVGAVPSTMHQRLIIWREDGLVENVETDQSAYISETGTVTLQNFDKNLASIAPCGEQDAAFDPNEVVSKNVYHSVKLHPTHDFCWEREDIDKPLSEDAYPPVSGWVSYNEHDD